MVKPDKTILLDANLLVLLVVGAVSQQLIVRHEKTRTFTPANYERLVELLAHHRIIVLPHVAAEASNLIGFHPEPERRRLLDVFKTFLMATNETYVPSREPRNSAIIASLA